MPPALPLTRHHHRTLCRCPSKTLHRKPSVPHPRRQSGPPPPFGCRQSGPPPPSDAANQDPPPLRMPPIRTPPRLRMRGQGGGGLARPPPVPLTPGVMALRRRTRVRNVIPTPSASMTRGRRSTQDTTATQKRLGCGIGAPKTASEAPALVAG